MQFWLRLPLSSRLVYYRKMSSFTLFFFFYPTAADIGLFGFYHEWTVRNDQIRLVSSFTIRILTINELIWIEKKKIKTPQEKESKNNKSLFF